MDSSIWLGTKLYLKLTYFSNFARIFSLAYPAEHGKYGTALFPVLFLIKTNLAWGDFNLLFFSESLLVRKGPGRSMPDSNPTKRYIKHQ